MFLGGLGVRKSPNRSLCLKDRGAEKQVSDWPRAGEPHHIVLQCRPVVTPLPSGLHAHGEMHKGRLWKQPWRKVGDRVLDPAPWECWSVDCGPLSEGPGAPEEVYPMGPAGQAKVRVP